MRTMLSISVFLAALSAPLLFYWLRTRRWGERVLVRVDPADPLPADVAGYLAEIARSLDANPRPLRVVFDGRNAQRRAIRLDVDPDRRLRVFVDGHRPRALDLRGRWIADHPVPLDLRRTVLYVKPVDANRFRVALRLPFRIPVVASVACSLVVTVALVFFQFEALAGALGFALGSFAATSFGSWKTSPWIDGIGSD